MLRVMLVDDSHEEESPLNEGLVAAGYDVVVVSALGLALAERVSEFAPDVIIIDTESPSRDVLEHVSVVSARAPRPIVLFTEDGENASIQAALKAGVSAYVVAGIQAERLQPILDVAVARLGLSHRLLGAGIVGTNAGELIAELVLGIEMGVDATDIGLSIHPHPTLSETVGLAAEAFEGTLTDLYMPKR